MKTEFDIDTGQMFYGVSAGWLSKPFDCSLGHILSSCNGSCCNGEIHWPSKAFGNKCGFLGEHGCVLSEKDKPISCMLFPIVLNRSNSLILFHRSMFKKGMCKGAFGKGQMLIDSQEAGLVYAFGREQFDRVRNDVINGKDSYFIVPEWVSIELEREAYYENRCIKPKPRATYEDKEL